MRYNAIRSKRLYTNVRTKLISNTPPIVKHVLLKSGKYTYVFKMIKLGKSTGYHVQNQSTGYWYPIIVRSINELCLYLTRKYKVQYNEA